jgi:hypothetical protein
LAVESATASIFTPEKRQVTAFVKQRAVDVVDRRGTVQAGTSAAHGAFIITLEYERHWKVTRLQTAKS